jgi:hypothetical protein
MCQLSVSSAAFLSTKAKTALPCLMASLRSASLAFRALLISSKAAEEGNLSVSFVSLYEGLKRAAVYDAENAARTDHRFASECRRPTEDDEAIIHAYRS